ncbi:Ig-like domain-containing protein [Wenzhouxiangella marina]|uniref:Ig-like domain-containing protein n=1 Tax=Wenzhouxiangella marina TaxID=1579979 RepID=UPI0006733E0D|nr:Ig-like domain-containing protein [Wenzhouxiangella marina]MBB6087892.1 hypothetical protein [Wenzhouxiangella marina]
MDTVEAARSTLAGEENLASLRNLPDNDTGLRFLFDSAPDLPIVSSGTSGLNPVQAILYEQNEIQLQIDGRLFCPPSGFILPAGAGGVRLLVKDASDHPVIDTIINNSSSQFLTYFPFGVADLPNVPVLFADPGRSVPCFFESPDGTLGLFGMEDIISQDVIFSSRFEENGMDTRGFTLVYENVSRTQATAGDLFQSNLNYDLVVRLDPGSADIASIGLQELLPMNSAFAGGVFAPDGGFVDVSCQPSNRCDGFILDDEVLRGQIGPLTSDTPEIRIEVTGRLISADSTTGSFARLSAGAVALDASFGTVPASDTAEASVWIVGNGTWIDAGDPINGVVVTGIDPINDTPVGVTVHSWDSDPALSETSPKQGIPVEVSSIEYCSDNCEIPQNWDVLITTPTIDGLIAQIAGQDRIRIEPAAATTEFLTTDPLTAGAEFGLYSEAAGQVRLTFSIPQNRQVSAGVRDAGGAQTQVVIDFDTDAAANIEILDPSIQATAGICTPFSAQVTDQFGNPVQGAVVSAGFVSSPAEPIACSLGNQVTDLDGLVGFEAGSQSAENLQVITSIVGTQINDTAPFNVAPGTPSQLVLSFDVGAGSFAIDEVLPPLVLTVQDQYGNTATSYSQSLLRLELRKGGAGGTEIITGPWSTTFTQGELIINGIDLSSLSASIIGTGRTLEAAARIQGNTVVQSSAPFEITAAEPAMTFELDPSGGAESSQTITATASLSGGVNPTGSIEIRNAANGDVLCSIDVASQTSCSIPPLSAGSYDIQAVYSGDAYNSTVTETISGYTVTDPAP